MRLSLILSRLNPLCPTPISTLDQALNKRQVRRSGHSFTPLTSLLLGAVALFGSSLVDASAMAQSQAQALRVVAVYDMSAVGGLSHGKEPRFFWKADERVSLSCGPERAPSGLGRPEAELMALRETPFLAILVEHLSKSEVGDGAISTPIRSDRLRLYIDTDDGTGETADAHSPRMIPDSGPTSISQVIDNKADSGAVAEAGGPNSNATGADSALTGAALPVATSSTAGAASGPKSGAEAVAPGLAAEGPVFLYPAVMPLSLEVKPKLSTVVPLLGQTLFFQTSVQLCTEHKLGRAWSGANNEALLDQAFLRSTNISPGEAFFRGQGRPIAAQLGPIHWSLDLYEQGLPRWLQEVWGDWPGDVQVGNNLVEADIWGARAPRKDRELEERVDDPSLSPELRALAAREVLSQVPFRAGGGEICAPRGLAEQMTSESNQCLIADPVPELTMTIDLGQSMLSSSAVRLKVHVSGMPDMAEETLLDKDVLDDARADDIVARLPRYFPHFRSARDPQRSYTLLLVPDWQISRALGPTRVREGFPTSKNTIDAVGYLLDHLDILHLQYVPTSASQVQDLLSPMRGLSAMLPGYSPGLWAAGAPVLLPEDEAGQGVTYQQHRVVFKNEWVLLEGVAMLLIGLVLVSSLPRLGELWQEPPIERAAHWPGEEEIRGIDEHDDGRAPRAGGNDGNA